MATGAVVAAAAAARAKRLQQVMDAFRVADATAPGRARPIAELDVPHDAEIAELTRTGVLLPGDRAGTWYLSETAVVERRKAREISATRGLVIALAISMLVATALLVTVLVLRD